MIEKVTIRLDGQSEFRLADGTSCDRLNPKALLLCAAAKCAGLTALAIMNKSRMRPAGIEIEFSGELSTDTVQSESMYTSFRVVYNVICAAEDRTAASRAIRLTHERHCSMIRMLGRIAPVEQQTNIAATEEIKN